MKKIVFIIIALFTVVTCFAQEKATENQSKSKTLEFISKGSTLIKKEFYNLGSVKGVECEVLIVTDLLDNSKIGCLRLETTYTGYSTSDTYIGTLDYDEIDDCIKSINYIKDNILNSVPNVYTETEYSTRDNIEIGAFYSERKLAWTAYVKTKDYTSRSTEYFDSTSLPLLLAIMTKAKTMIEEKVK